MASAKDVGGINEIFGYVVSMEEPSLVIVDEKWDERFYSIGENLGHRFWSAVLKRDWSKCIFGGWGLGFREENHESSIEALQRCGLIMESREEREDGVFDFILVFAKEDGSETVGAWAGICVHG